MLNVKKTHFTFEACGSVIILKTAGSFNWSCMCLTGNVGLCVMKLYLFLAFLLCPILSLHIPGKHKSAPAFAIYGNREVLW